jgi:hypothetical protein
MSMNDIGLYLVYQFFYGNMAGEEGKVKVIPAGRKDMFGYTGNYPAHRIVRNEVNLPTTLCEIFCPALGMDAAAICDEEEDHPLFTCWLFHICI